jgi:hypothetical protein
LDNNSTPNKRSEIRPAVARSDLIKIKIEDKVETQTEEFIEPSFEVLPWTWSTGKYIYYIWRFPDQHFKIKLGEDPATGLVYAMLALTIPKPAHEDISAICAIGDMYEQLKLEDQTFTWEIPVPNAISRDAVEPLKISGFKGFKVNTAFKPQQTEW